LQKWASQKEGEESGLEEVTGDLLSMLRFWHSVMARTGRPRGDWMDACKLRIQQEVRGCTVSSGRDVMP
jgi:hypothetical protein